MIKILLCALTLFCGVSMSALGADANWLTDMEAAKAASAKENKPILMFFSGVGWCPDCIKLDKYVFSKSDFKDYAKENLVLLLIDFPKKQSPELYKYLSGMQKKYGTKVTPMVFLLDAKGETFAKIDDRKGEQLYGQGGPEAYVNHIKKLIADKK